MISKGGGRSLPPLRSSPGRRGGRCCGASPAPQQETRGLPPPRQHRRSSPPPHGSPAAPPLPRLRGAPALSQRPPAACASGSPISRGLWAGRSRKQPWRALLPQQAGGSLAGLALRPASRRPPPPRCSPIRRRLSIPLRAHQCAAAYTRNYKPQGVQKAIFCLIAVQLGKICLIV